MRRQGYARRTYRREFRRWVRVNKTRLISLLSCYVGCAALQTFLFDGYWAGLTQGVLGTAFLAIVAFAFVATTGSLRQVAGAWGEDNTRDTLRWAKRRRLIFGWVDNVEVQGGDIDHLVATPAGWFAIDSKWHSCSYDRDVIAQDADRASRAARRASLVLRSLNHRTIVRPIAACWGGTRHEIPQGHATIHGVDFVSGTYLKQWLRSLPTDGLDRRAARAVLADLRQFRRRVCPPDPASASPNAERLA